MVNSLKEWLRFERHWSKALFFPALVVGVLVFRVKGSQSLAKFLSSVFRLNWPGTAWLTEKAVKLFFLNPDNRLKIHVYDEFVENAEIQDRYKRFSDNPTLMLNGIATVLASPSNQSKGVIVLKYSYYFILFLKFFDVDEIIKRYHIVLEPSWNGLCDESILAFARLSAPVFVMAYENIDYQFIDNLGSNLVPLRLSSNWWISPEQFLAGNNKSERDIDIIMVASWARFKRHDRFFEALRQLRDDGYKLKTTLVGYPNDLTLSDIKQLADDAGILDSLTFYEWISPDEVSSLLGRSKVNIVWSRFEGLNRAIIEGMFCNTPCILRDGFNFGMEYPYVNSATGCFSSEKDLSKTILRMIEKCEQYSPREYVIKHHNCYEATKVLASTISEFDPHFNKKRLVPKVSGLDGMEYLSKEDAEKFNKDYDFLGQHCCKG